jgi:hypothetical protein
VTFRLVAGDDRSHGVSCDACDTDDGVGGGVHICFSDCHGFSSRGIRIAVIDTLEGVVRQGLALTLVRLSEILGGTRHGDIGMRIEVTRDGEAKVLDPRDTELSSLFEGGPAGIVVWSDDFSGDLSGDREVYVDESFTWTPIQEEEIVEALKMETVVLDDESWEAGLLFETGGCSQLAKALAQRNHGCGVVAVYDAVDEDGGPLQASHLIHAALAVGDGHVLDANGVSTFEAWFEQWSALGMEPFFERYEPGGAPFSYASNSYRLVSQEFAFALSVACARSLTELSARHTPSPR